MPPNSQPEVSGQTGTHTRVVGFVSLAVILVAILGVFFRADLIALFSGSAQREVQNALILAEAGDFQNAIREAQKALAQGTDEEKAVARSIIEVAGFRSGDPEKRLEAIRLTKETYLLLEGNPQRQSAQVNELLGYFNSASEQYVFDEIFKGEPFEKFLVPNDRALSIRKLAEHSLALWPSVEAQFRIGAWHAGQILNTKGLTKAQRQKHADEILKVISSADAMIGEQIARDKNVPFGYMVEPRYFFWKVNLYGAVARVYARHLQDARSALDSLVATYNTSLDEYGNKRALIAARLPSAYFLYAIAVYRVKGESGVQEARHTLDALVALVEENPAVHAGSYLAAIGTGAEASQSADRDQFARNYAAYIALAKIHPPFKAFLEEHGWRLP